MSVEWLIVPMAAFFASVISGLGEFGGALILVIILTPIVGVKAVIPLISVFATCNNLSRVFIYRKHIILENSAPVYSGFTSGCIFWCKVARVVARTNSSFHLGVNPNGCHSTWTIFKGSQV